MNGIPNLLYKIPRAATIAIIGDALNSLYDYFFQPPKWGVFIPGTTRPAFAISSVVEQDLVSDSQISDYPIDTGTFTTYNKVMQPKLFMLRLTKDGTDADRASFLNWLEKEQNDFNLFDILCPERAYKNVNLKSYRITRTSSNGVGRIIADCMFQEIRQLQAFYVSYNITSPDNKEATPAARVNPVESTEVFPQ